MFKEKGLIIGILITTVLIIGGVYFFTKDNNTQSNPTVINSNILIPQGEYQTGGIINGEYLPATESAKLTLVEFGDYQCPACVLYHPFIKKILSEFPGQINFVFRNFPLSQHPNAEIASQAVEAAGIQGKYWQMHDKIYESGADWHTSTNAKNIFIGYASEFGLDVDRYKADIDSSIVKDNIKNDMNDAQLVKLQETPTYYLNGSRITILSNKYDDFKNIIESELAK